MNPKLHGLGHALWWAWINVTSVGAAIFFRSRPSGKVVYVLPSLGMMFSPLFDLRAPGMPRKGR